MLLLSIIVQVKQLLKIPICIRYLHENLIENPIYMLLAQPKLA